MDFDAYYNQRDSASDQAKEAIVLYNERIDVLREMIPRLVQAFQSRPPTHCDWIYLDGNRQASWQLYREYDFECMINLLPDGRLVWVYGSGGNHGSLTNHVRNIVEPKKITKLYSGWEISDSALADIYNSVLSLASSAIPNYPESWNRARRH